MTIKEKKELREVRIQMFANMEQKESEGDACQGG